MYRILALFLIISLLTGCSCDRNEPQSMTYTENQEENNITDDQLLANAQQQISNYDQYKYSEDEAANLLRLDFNEDINIYLLANNNKRYLFPNLDIWRTWFKDYPLENIKKITQEESYQTEFVGNIYIRPGTIMQTPTDINYYVVYGDGNAAKIDLNLIEKIYGDNYQDYVVEIPNKYFTQYKRGQYINDVKDFPEIPQEINVHKIKNIN